MVRSESNSESREASREPHVLIVGAGVGGLCMAMQLRRTGRDNFLIVERSREVGGTWHDNSYPGASCDVPSFLYSFSFFPKVDWSRKFARQPEILEYLRECARRFELYPRIRFGTEVTEAVFDEAHGRWEVRTSAGETYRPRVLVAATGQLNRPYIPDIPGREDFRGTAFHSARWDHSHDLRGRRVALIGNAASAVQIAPEIAPIVDRLVIFQRSANWVVPRRDRAFRAWERAAFRSVPGLARLYRWSIWARFELRYSAMLRGSRIGRWTEAYARRFLRQEIQDPRLRAVLTPDYPVGCKRILLSDDYYATLRRENVELVTAPIERITPAGIRTGDGQERSFDTIVFATGFRTTEFLAPMRVRGRGGVELSEAWREGAEAYLGIAVPRFPNFFMLYGPNTNLGHNSIIFMIECQVRYVLNCLRLLERAGAPWLDPDPRHVETYNREIQAAMDRLVWSSSCRSWYKNESGRVTNNWPYTTVAYWWRTRRPEAEAFAAA